MATTTDQSETSKCYDLLFLKNIKIRNLKDHLGEPLNRIVAFWKRNDLLPFIEEGKWAEVSFAQLVWIRILDDLRKINFPVSKMKLVCDYFFKDAYSNDLPKKNLQFNKEQILKRIRAGTQEENDFELLAKIENILKNDKTLYILKFDVNYLSNFIGACLTNRKDGLIYISFDGNVTEFLEDAYWGHKEINFELEEPHIRLTLSNYLKEFMDTKELKDLIVPTLLKSDEAYLIKQMSQKGISEINIKKTPDSKQLVIKTSKNLTLPKEKQNEVKRLLGLGQYETITVKSSHKDDIHISSTKAHKS